MTSIIGLDPAGPVFEDNYKEQKLDKDDAKYVQILHTNFKNYGHFRPMGHVEFYLNGGETQDQSWLFSAADVMSYSHSIAFEFLIDIYRDPYCPNLSW